MINKNKSVFSVSKFLINGEITTDNEAIAHGFNTLRPKQNGHRFADDIFKRIFLNENVRISIKISLKFVPKGPINNIPALVQIMARRRSGYKPLSESMMVSLLTHLWVTRPQWINNFYINIVPNFAAQIPSSLKSPTSYMEAPNLSSVFPIPVTSEEICSIIRSLKTLVLDGTVSVPKFWKLSIKTTFLS